MSGSVAERYLLLGLRLGRHAEGIVDAYYGPPELAEAVASAEPVEPRLLVDDAEALLEEVPDGWLRDQIAGLRTYAGALAGDTATYSDEVEGCYGVRPPFTDEDVFAAAHAERVQAAGELPGCLRHVPERPLAAPGVPRQLDQRAGPRGGLLDHLASEVHGAGA